MSSQDSEEDCPVSYQPLDKNIFKDTYPYIWYPDEEGEDEPVPPRFKQESKEALCKRIIKLEIENDELRIDNFTLRRKLEKEKGKPASSTTTSIFTNNKEGDIITWVWALPLATAKLGGGAPVSYHKHISYLYHFS